MPVTEAAFRTAVLPFTLHEEGGLSLDKNDKGNWIGDVVGRGMLKGTKYVIAAASHPALDIRHLTLAQVCDIYWAEYCVQPGIDRLALPLLLPVFDAGVNCGAPRARAWLAAVSNHGGEADQIRAFSALNLAYHKRLPTWRRYGKVWGGRVERAEVQGLKLLAAAPALVAPRVPTPAVSTARAADSPSPIPSSRGSPPRSSLPFRNPQRPDHHVRYARQPDAACAPRDYPPGHPARGLSWSCRHQGPRASARVLSWPPDGNRIPGPGGRTARQENLRSRQAVPGRTANPWG